MSIARYMLLAIALVCVGIATGSAYTFFFDFNPRDSTMAFWVIRLQHAIRHAGIALFVVQPAAFAAALAALVLSWRDRPAVWFLMAAALAFVVGALVTRFGNVPLNWQIEMWKPDALPTDAPVVVARWWTFHLVRFAALAVGFLALVAATLLGAGSRR